MSDLISRKAAIDAIRASTSKYTGFMEMEMYTDDDAIEAIEALPSAQPEPCDDAVSKKAESITATANDVIIDKTYYTGNLTSPHLSLISDEILERIGKLERDTRFDYTEVSCRNCGGKILQKIDDHILKCPYCGTAYIIGRYQINS